MTKNPHLGPKLALYFDVPAAQVKAGDWVGLFDSGAAARSYHTYWRTGGAGQGVVTHVATRAQFGELEMRYLRADYTELATSTAVRHGPRLVRLFGVFFRCC